MNRRTLAKILAGAAHTYKKRASCATGGFYISPSQGQTVSSSSPFNITWDTSCLSGTQAVDIYLIAPGMSSSRIHEWQNVDYSDGNYQTTLQPKWWNDSSTIDLQLSIVTYNTQPFLSPLPAGPVFTATYTAPSDGTIPAAADLTSPGGITYVGNFPTSSSSKGKIAAGILVPLFFIALGIAAYFKMSRSKAKERTRRFSEAIDKRMSTISVDWRSMSAAGAHAAIRHSMAISTGGSRNSAFSFGAIRPHSTVAVEGTPSISDRSASLDVPHMSQLRPALPYSPSTERISRVSFAADVRPSIESRRTVGTSRAYHTAFVPPLPSDDKKQSADEQFSPTQTSGPLTLTPEDIRARMSGEKTSASEESMDEVWPSLSMMRTGNESTGNDYLLQPEEEVAPMPVPPEPVYPAPESHISMMPMPDSVMSPDDMLRAYAESRIKSPPPTASAPFPVPAASYNSNGMRTLYTPTSPTLENRYTIYSDDESPYLGATN